jgi:diguanylate cyclase (GGDEF)-like protein/PAS domain S-box-containing protein
VVLIGLASLVTTFATAILLGQSITAMFRLDWGIFTQMAPHTAAGFVIVGIGTMRAVLHELGSIGDASPRRAVAAWTVLTISLILSIVAWYATSTYLAQREQARFNLLITQMTSAIDHRMHDQRQILVGTKGLFAASTEVTRTEFRAYLDTRSLEREFPGLGGVGFAARVSAAQRAAHVQSLRAEGLKNYDILPAGVRDEYVPVVYIEPDEARNRRALGYDMFSERTRREAMERARDSGEPVVSGKVVLIQDADQGKEVAGFLLYVPIYRNGTTPEQVGVRRNALQGFVYSPIRVKDLFLGIQELDNSGIALRVYDNLNPDPRALLYDNEADLDAQARTYRPRFEDTRSLEVGNRYWMLRFHSRPRFDAGLPTYEPIVVLFGCVVVSLLLFGMVWSLTSTRERAVALAETMTHKLRESELRYRLLADGSQGLICEHDRAGMLLYVNDAAASILGYTPEQMIGRPLSDFLSPRVRDHFGEYLARVTAGRDEGMMSITTRSGEERVWKYVNAPCVSPSGEDRILGNAQDITEMIRAQRELKAAKEVAQEQASVDALTGLSNRRTFDLQLTHAVEQARRQHERLAVLFVDLDGFKKVNDTYGHEVGDELLRHVGAALTRTIRKSDLAARFGGDEFALILTNIGERKNAESVSKKLLTNLQTPLSGHSQITPRASIGISLFPEDGETPSALLGHADTAMYDTKRKNAVGRN